MGKTTSVMGGLNDEHEVGYRAGMGYEGDMDGQTAKRKIRIMHKKHGM
jgi:hypothetical protein